jgi:hypothetical protein
VAALLDISQNVRFQAQSSPLSADDEPEAPYLSPEEIRAMIAEHFDENGLFRRDSIGAFTPLLSLPEQFKRVRIDPAVWKKLDDYWLDRQLAELAGQGHPDFSVIKTRLYPYQQECD